MAVHFDRARMAEVIENHGLWWDHKLGRPLAYIEINNAHKRPESKYPLLSQANCHDLDVDPEQIIVVVVAAAAAAVVIIVKKKKK